MKQTLPSMRTLLTEGMSAVRRYKGLAATLYFLQFAVAIAFMWAVTSMLAGAFAERPLFDRAVAGDVAALVFVVTDEPYVFSSILWFAVATIVGYWVISWYLMGGLNAVLIERPSGKTDVVKQFGAGGARTFFGYARLTLLSLIPYAIISGVLGYGLSHAADDLFYGLTAGDVAWVLFPKLLPGLVLLALHVTAVDYARIALSRTLGLSSRHALWRAYRTIVSDWRPLAHIVIYVAFFSVVSLLYMLLAHGHPMHGAVLAIVLFGLRQVLLVVRFAGKLTCAAGQVVYASARAPGSNKRLPVV